MNHLLYKTTNLINNKIYIGVHSTNDLNDGYLGSGLAITHAIKKYGKENFKRDILQEFDTREEALLEEVKIVDGDFIRQRDNYNTNTGGGHNWYGMVSVKDEAGNTFQVAKDDPRYLSGELVGIASGKILTKNKNGNIIQVSIDDPRYLSGELVPFSSGMVSVKNKDGNAMQVSVDDPRYLSRELVSVNKDWIQCIDPNGNRIRVSKDDPRYLCGELVPWSKDQIVVRASDGNKLRVDKDDPRYLSGKLIPITKGLGMYKDKSGNFVQASTDDPRVISGELVGATKGNTFKHKKKMELRKCPHCGKEGRGGRMTVHHFDNCKYNSDK